MLILWLASYSKLDNYKTCYYTMKSVSYSGVHYNNGEINV